MVETLSIYTLLDDGTSISFPQSKTPGEYLPQAKINAYTFTAGRMGSINVQATLMYKLCLDEYWSQREYIEFRGEKYFILSTPTSSKSNTDIRYKHELNFVSERVMLDNTYFFDVVSPDAEDVDQFVSNSTKFTFFGDINEFAKRMNYSLQYSKLGYSIVVDDGVSSEAKLMSFEDKYFSEVLQEVFNVYELPYYFVGKVIHIGFTSNAITHEFRYGYDKELLSITKTNANYKIVNRCTGIGSTENIPYYYPNETRKTEVGVEADPNNTKIKQEDIIISDEKKFKEQVSVNEYVEYKESPLADAYHITSFMDNGFQAPYEFRRNIQLAVTSTSNSVPKTRYWDGYIYVRLQVFKSGKYEFAQSSSMRREHKNSSVEKPYNWSPRWGHPSGNNLKIYFGEAGEGERELQDNTTDFTIYNTLGDLVAGKDYILKFHYYYSRNQYIDYTLVWASLNSLSIRFTGASWFIGDNPTNLSRIGITINKEPAIGDKFRQIKIENDYMITSPNLLPPIYRQTWGAERFYNAINNTYINPDTGEYYDFENEYTDGNPKEMIVSFDYIKPTIKGIKNAAGNLIGEILDVAFDTDDNDEISAETNAYEHKYFYIKLRKFDGEYGFNIFEQGIASGEMTISVTSGNCAACNFKIGVVESTKNSNIFYNPVQVDNYGNIVSGNFEDKVNEKNIQPQQQNTITNEVWIAVEKDTDTFGTIMPSYNRNYKPKTGDSFVIVNINLPNEYIYNAENELKEAIIKYMAANNSEKFNFSINFKRIFFANYPEVLAQLDENARLIIEYDGKKHTLYVSNFTYKVSEKEILPEISVELADTITIRKGSMQKSIDAVKQDIMSSIGSIDFLKMGLKYFIRKDVDDSANGHLVFKKGLYVTNEGEGVAALQEGDTNAIQEGDTNAIQEYTESLEEPVIPTSMTLGELENVNSIVDTPSVEDVVLVKKAGTGTWTQEKKNISSSEKVYVTTLNIGKIESDLPDVTQEDKDEVFNIIQKYKDGYVVIYAQDEVSVNDTVTRYTPLNVVLSEDETQVWITYHSENGIRYTLTTTPILEVGATWDYQREIIEAPIDGKTYGRRNRTWIEIKQSGGSSDINYVRIDYAIFSELYADDPTDSSAIIMAIGQENLNRMFSEDECPVEFYNVLADGLSIFTKCVLKGAASGISLISIPIEAFNLAYNIMLQNGAYLIERNPYITFDSVLDGNSMNAPQTRTVYNELATKVGIYRTSFRFGEIEEDWNYGKKTVTTEQQAELQRIRSAIIAGKLVLTNDETGNTFYKGVVNYVTADDSSWISLVIADDRGNPRCFTYDGTASNPEWDIHGVEVEGGNTGNTNIKYLTTPGLFNRSRDEVITLNANDVSIINSLYGKKYRNVQLYYIGSPAGDWGIYPVIAACNAFEEESQIGNAGESIYLSILNEVSVPVSEHLSVDSPTELITGNNAKIPNALFSTASSISPNGYEKFNDGLMIQWGKSSTSGREFSITLPVSFYSNNYNVQLTMDYLTDNLCEINVGQVQMNSKFTVTTKILNERGIMEIIDTSFHWVAIGRWK